MFESLVSSLEINKFELELQRSGQGLEDFATGWNDLLSNAITRDETY